MTKEELRGLGVGDLVRHKTWKNITAIVSENHGDRATIVITFDATNPDEWDLLFKANYRRSDEESCQ